MQFQDIIIENILGYIESGIKKKLRTTETSCDDRDNREAKESKTSDEPYLPPTQPTSSHISRFLMSGGLISRDVAHP